MVDANERGWGGRRGEEGTVMLDNLPCRVLAGRQSQVEIKRILLALCACAQCLMRGAISQILKWIISH